MERAVKQTSLLAVQESALAALTRLRDETEHLFETDGRPSIDITSTLQRLFHYLSCRSQAASFLISADYAWDAEILLRSFTETAMRIVFICTAPRDLQADLVSEYRDQLSVVYDRRRANHAAHAISLFTESGDDNSTTIFAALQNHELAEPGVGGNKASRKALEQKWSFAGMIETLDQRPTADGRSPRHLKSMLHGYALSSHLLHGDVAALDLMTDRVNREPAELRALKAAHACRIMTDQVNMTYFCVDSLRRSFNAKFADEGALTQAIRLTNELSEPFGAAFYETQRALYEPAPTAGCD